jgi:hypothetical protein
MPDRDRDSVCTRALRARAILRLRRSIQWIRQELKWGATTRRSICGITVGVLPFDRFVTPEAQDLTFEKILMSVNLIAEGDPPAEYETQFQELQVATSGAGALK